MASPGTKVRVDPLTRDAMAVLAHLYLRFGRPAAAEALLAALAEIDADAGWARRVLCIARFRAGRYEETAAEAAVLLADGLDDVDRLPLLHVAILANWRLGRVEEARKWREALTAASATTVIRANGGKA